MAIMTMLDGGKKRIYGSSLLTTLGAEAMTVTPALLWSLPPSPPPITLSTCQNLKQLTNINYYYELDLMLRPESIMKVQSLRKMKKIGQLNHDQKYEATKVLSLNIKNLTCGQSTTISDQKKVRESLKETNEEGKMN